LPGRVFAAYAAALPHILRAVMKIGLIGAGNMAAALARGWGEPLLVHDVDRARAEALAAEHGGDVAESNAALAEAADVVVLAHKPAQLEEVAAQTDDRAKAIVSILGGTHLDEIERVYPGRPVYRFMPNIPAEVGQGVFCYSPGSRASEGPERAVRELFERAGTVIELPEPLIEPATALMGCGPAFFALVVESLVDAGGRHGIPSDLAGLMTVEAMAGTAAVLRESGHDAPALRRRVTSPGGSTERGLAALEDGGLRSAFDEAVDAVVEVGRK
jgi:pyrroline-5-carboxylate reductase